MMFVLWRSYLQLLHRYPMRMQATNTCLLMGAGDFISQLAVERKSLGKDYELVRTARFMGVGLCVFGPGMHIWYSMLDKVIRGTRFTAVAKKVFMDQAFFLPFYLGTFIVLMAFLRRENIIEIQEKVQRDYKPMLITSYELWPAVQVLNFAVIPNHHRVLVINFVGLLWNTYLSYKAEQA